MLKFLRKYTQGLLVAAGVLLMVAFLLPQAISEMARSRQNVTVLKIGDRKISNEQFNRMASEYNAISVLASGALPLMGLDGGARQWVLLCELANRAGFIGSAGENHDILEDIGRLRGRARLAADPTYRGLLNNPQFAPFLENMLQQDVDLVVNGVPHAAAQAHLTDKQMNEAIAKLKGVLRYMRAYTNTARVSSPRILKRAEHELEGAQVEYIFIPADRDIAEVPAPDDATLEAFLEKYKDTKPGEGEFGVGYLLGPRVKLEYLVMDAKKVGDKVVPDLKELRRRYNAMEDKSKSFDDVRPQLEQQIRRETVEEIMRVAQNVVHSATSQFTLQLPDDGQYKLLPSDWMSKRPALAGMVDEIVAKVEVRTRPEQDKPGIRIDPPQVILKDQAFLTADELGALEGIGRSYLMRGQRRIMFPDYALAVKELTPNSQLSLQVGLPCDEPTRGADSSSYFFTILGALPESTPKSIDDVRERIASDWKRVQAYKILVDRDVEALRKKAVAEGLASLDDTLKTPPEPGKPAPQPQLKSGRVTRSQLSTNDPKVNSDTFREAVLKIAAKLDPLKSADDYTQEERVGVVPLPQSLGVAVVRIRSLLPLTTEEIRGAQANLAAQYQTDEFRALKDNPFSLDNLRRRLNAKFLGPESEKLNGEEGSEG